MASNDIVVTMQNPKPLKIGAMFQYRSNGPDFEYCPRDSSINKIGNPIIITINTYATKNVPPPYFATK